jgi:arylsulfatase A-like enzyme
VPCIVRWSGKIAPGATSDRVTGFEDWLPTFLELLGDASSREIDGISFAPTLRGEQQPPRPFLYRESPSYTGQQTIRMGDWKLVRRNLHPGPKQKNPPAPTTELYNLSSDPSERVDVAGENPEVVQNLMAVAKEQHVASPLFPIRALDSAQ